MVLHRMPVLSAAALLLAQTVVSLTFKIVNKMSFCLQHLSSRRRSQTMLILIFSAVKEFFQIAKLLKLNFCLQFDESTRSVIFHNGKTIIKNYRRGFYMKAFY